MDTLKNKTDAVSIINRLLSQVEASFTTSYRSSNDLDTNPNSVVNIKKRKLYWKLQKVNKGLNSSTIMHRLLTLNVDNQASTKNVSKENIVTCEMLATTSTFAQHSITNNPRPKTIIDIKSIEAKHYPKTLSLTQFAHNSNSNRYNINAEETVPTRSHNETGMNPVTLHINSTNEQKISSSEYMLQSPNVVVPQQATTSLTITSAFKADLPLQYPLLMNEISIPTPDIFQPLQILFKQNTFPEILRSAHTFWKKQRIMKTAKNNEFLVTFPTSPLPQPHSVALSLEFQSPNSESKNNNVISENNPSVNTGKMEKSVNLKFIDGFGNLSKHLYNIHPDYVKLSCGGSVHPSEWSFDQSNPCFSYSNNPLTGWRKDVTIRLSGKLSGNLDVSYVPPKSVRKYRNKSELTNYFATKSNSENNSAMLLSTQMHLFDFRTVYCVCHQPETLGNTRQRYLECSYGRAGCHGWIHPECVGLTHLSEKDLDDLDQIICPFCVYFLEGFQDFESLENKLLLRKVTFVPPPTYHETAGKMVEEYSLPHETDDWENHMTAAVNTSLPQVSTSTIAATATSALVSEMPILKHQLFQSSITFPSPTPSTNQPNAAACHESDETPNESMEHSRTKGTVPYKSFLTYYANAATHDSNDTEKHDNDSASINSVASMDINAKNIEDDTNKEIDNNDNNSDNETNYTYWDEDWEDYVPLSSQYTQTLIDNAIQLFRTDNQTQRQKKQKVHPSTVAAVETAAYNTEMTLNQTLYYEQQQLAPILCYLPTEDGGLRVSCVSEGRALPKSLHSQCSIPCTPTSGPAGPLLCGYCLVKIDEPMVQDIPAASSSSTKRKTSNNKKNRSKNEKSTSHKTIVSVGVVDYDIHTSCAFMMECIRNNINNDFENIDNVLAVSPSHDGEQHDLHEWTEMKLNKNNNTMLSLFQTNSNLQIGPFYEFEEVADADCDLCGRVGSVLEFFYLSKEVTHREAPTSDGWLGHAPCIYWLLKSNLLEPFSKHENIPQYIEADSMTGAEGESSSDPQYLSRFDRFYGAAKCALCGLYSGICIRCCGLNCNVRVHAICAMQAMHTQQELLQLQDTKSFSDSDFTSDNNMTPSIRNRPQSANRSRSKVGGGYCIYESSIVSENNDDLNNDSTTNNNTSIFLCPIHNTFF